MAGRTGNHELEKALRIPDLAGAPALAAGFAGRPRRGARAVAFPAGDHPGDVQSDFRTPRRLREGDVQIVAQIRARRGARPAAACTAAHAESKHIPKDITEMSEDIFGGPKASEVAVVSDTGVTELIVPRPALRIAQHFIGFGGLFETLFGFRVVGVVVGVVLQCHLAVSPLDFVFRRIAGYTENFIIIALGHSGSNLSRQKGLVVHVRLRFACGHTILGHILREDLSGGDFTQRGHGFLVARLDQRLVAFTVLSHAFDRHLYEEKPVFDAFLTVFNGDACHSAASKKDGLLPIS